ncbi:MAG: HlyD family type I secretion periplasmic adaptor subunit [Lentisphaeria bacterium]|nr:HlyD family type I secretion periplasmic adaptor subunit [Lentisphaeria bacterium]
MKLRNLFSRRKQEIPSQAIEFQPDALEIANSRLPLWARYSVIFAFLFLLGALLWSIFGQVDVIVTGNGKIVSDKQTIVMKPLELTVIEKIHVRVGQVVKPGDVLITFRPTINMAEAHRLELEVDSLTAQFERLQAEFYGNDYHAKSKERFPQLQEAIFKQRREYFQQKISYYDEALKQLDAQKKSREVNLAKQRERLAEIQKLEKSFAYLMERKAMTLKTLTETKLSRMQMEATVDEMENSLLELIHQRESTVSSKNAFIQEWRNAISEKLVETERELSANQQQYEKNRMRVDSLQLRAPCEAVVHEIAAFSQGSAVREAEALITLIPLDGKLELEVEIRPQDIGKIGVGSEARIKLTAWPFQKHGTLEGVVRNISEDTFSKQARGTEIPGDSMTFYRTRITIGGKLTNVPASFRLIPGMEVTAEIKTGRRRIIEYLIYPLIKALDETAREP